MALVLFVWTFIFICLFGLGWACLRLATPQRVTEFKAPHPFLLSVVGLAAVIALGNCWAYFAPIGMVLNGVVLGLAVLTLLIDRNAVSAYFQFWTGRSRTSGWPTKLAFAALLFIALVKSAAPTELLDEGDYYLPYIRWMENYRIIPGLANIEGRLGFNSAFHMASAFFGLSWLVPGGSYDLNGLLLLLFGTWCLQALARLLKPGSTILMSDVMKLFCLFFLMRNMLTSSAADLSNMIFSETVLILFARKIEERSVARADAYYYLIVLIAVLTVTIKLNSVLLVLVPAFLTVRTLLADQRLPWTKLVVLAAVLVLPWLGRYTILSGYLVYPVYQVDLFNLDWKVPMALTEQEYHYVAEFSKTNARPEESKQLAEQRTMLDWVPQWFARENLMNRAMGLAMLTALLALITYGIFYGRRLLREQSDHMALGVILVLGIGFWFARNPAFRFGWSWGIILLAFCLHASMASPRLRPWLRVGTVALLALSLVSNTVKTITESRMVLAHQFFVPASLPQANVRKATLGPLQVLISHDRQCWGEQPPCLPAGHQRRIQPRGNTVKDGFRPDPASVQCLIGKH
ncbi:MAG: hypothetical protein WBB32_11470 [Flavobacteriales bacterium]